MKRISFYLSYSLLWLITRLPIKSLYPVSDFLYLVLYHLLGYRKKVVIQNLTKSFPEKPESEIQQITRNFYHHLCDLFLESVYVINMKAEEINKRFRYKNPELISQSYTEKKSIMLLASHYGNWEWSCNLNFLSDHVLMGVYKPLNNPYWDRALHRIRSRTGGLLLPMENSLRILLEHKRRNMPVLFGTLIDQRPFWDNLNHWRIFLNQDTPVITGPERIARKLGMPVYFLAVRKIKRGFYEAEFIPVSLDPAKEPEYFITNKYHELLEKDIREEPDYWLWSHNRWKYKRTDADDLIVIDQPRNS